MLSALQSLNTRFPLISEYGIAPKRVTATEMFEAKDEGARSKRYVIEDSGPLSGAVMNDLVLPTDNTIGIK